MAGTAVFAMFLLAGIWYSYLVVDLCCFLLWEWKC